MLVFLLYLLVEVRVKHQVIWLFVTIVIDPGGWLHFLVLNKLIVSLVV